MGTFPAPLDIPGVIGPWLDHARPSRLILLEGELWPGWISACRKRGIPMVVVSARKGPGWKRWQKQPALFAWLTRGVHFLYAEDLGDLKREAALPPPAFEVRQPAIVGASTRSGDEEMLVTAWERLPQPRPLLILAPRHLERTKQVLSLLKSHSVSVRSEGLQADADVWLLDTHGELAGIMKDAHIAFIGGTFSESLGGHSPSEAAAAGAHIVHGPHTHSNPTAWSGLDTSPVETVEELAEQLQAQIGRTRPKKPTPSIDLATIVNALPEPVRLPETTGTFMLWPAVPVWTILTKAVRHLQGSSKEVGFVVVGGLVNGGAGRTPVAAWLGSNIDHARIISAGYRRKGAGADIRHGHPDQSPEKELGDELEMMRRRGLQVISAPKRLQGVADCKPIEVPVIDGGLGDPRLEGGYRIVCIDGETPGGRGPFPVGSRRLPWSILNQVNAVWLSNPSEHASLPKLPKNIPLIRSHLKPSRWIHRGKDYPLDAIQGEIDVVVGIANPERFICTLLDLNLTIRSIKFVGDHAPLGPVPTGVVLTEKDAARLPIDTDAWALRMELEVHGAEPVLQQIREHCT